MNVLNRFKKLLIIFGCLLILSGVVYHYRESMINIPISKLEQTPKVKSALEYERANTLSSVTEFMRNPQPDFHVRTIIGWPYKGRMFVQPTQFCSAYTDCVLKAEDRVEEMGGGGVIVEPHSIIGLGERRYADVSIYVCPPPFDQYGKPMRGVCPLNNY